MNVFVVWEIIWRKYSDNHTLQWRRKLTVKKHQRLYTYNEHSLHATKVILYSSDSVTTPTIHESVKALVTKVIYHYAKYQRLLIQEKQHNAVTMKISPISNCSHIEVYKYY